MIVITIILNDQLNTDGSFKNKQVIKCGEKAFRTQRGTPMNSMDINQACKDIAYDIHRTYHSVGYYQTNE